MKKIELPKMDLEIWDKTQLDKMATKTIIQAVKDFAFPNRIGTVKSLVRKYKNDPCYLEHKEKIFKRARLQIIKDLKQPFMVLWSDGISKARAIQLQEILEDSSGIKLKALKRNVKNTEREIKEG